MNQGVGEKFQQSIGNISGYSRNVYKVEPGDKLKFSFNPCASYTYAYYIIGANDIILEAVSKSSGNFSDEVIDIPVGAELFVFNYATSVGQAVYIRRNKNNSIIKDTVYKESDLLGMSERKNLSDKDVYRNKILTLAWITDTHGDERNYRRFIEYVDAHAGVIDGILHTGDMNRMSDTDGGFEKTVAKYISKVPLLPVMGNHDSHGTTNDGKGNTARQVLSSGSQKWQAAKYVTPFIDSHCVQGGTIGNEDCYFYRDFDEYKIRVICLHEYDMPRNVYTSNWATTSDPVTAEWEAGVSYNTGTVVNYKGLHLKAKTTSKLLDNGDYYATRDVAPWSSYNRDGRYLQQAQVDFLINALLDEKLDEEWGIIIATHQVVEDYVSGSIANEKFHDDSSVFLKVSNLQVGNIISDILGAYISGHTLTQTYNVDKSKLAINTSTISDVGYPPIEVNTNFGTKVNRANIICCLNGHSHNCGCYWLNNCADPSNSSIKYKILNINQETGCYMPDTIQQNADKYTRFNVSDVIKGGSLAQDCFNIISFDTVNHVIQLLRIGADTTDKHIKRDYARISYEYKISIPEKSGISLVPENMGTTRPSNPSNGELFFDTTLGRTIIWNGTKWVEEDGASAGVLRFGPASYRDEWVPSISIYAGFKYYDTTYGYYVTWDGEYWVNPYGQVYDKNQPVNKWITRPNS